MKKGFSSNFQGFKVFLKKVKIYITLDALGAYKYVVNK